MSIKEQKLKIYKALEDAEYLIHHPYDVCWTFGRPSECKTNHDRRIAINYRALKYSDLLPKEEE